jgi:hypothetical protein
VTYAEAVGLPIWMHGQPGTAFEAHSGIGSLFLFTNRPQNRYEMCHDPHFLPFLVGGPLSIPGPVRKLCDSAHS